MGYLLVVAFVGAYPFLQAPPGTFHSSPQLRIYPWANRQVDTGRPKVTLKPGQACAIPLLNVLTPRNKNVDRMAIPAPSFRPLPGDVVEPPAPSCDDVK
jgi:hypothetical protein